MSVKQFAGCFAIGVAASLSWMSVADAQSAAMVTVNNSSQAVQVPTLPVGAPATGISYRQNGAGGGLLVAYTSGFLFCANPSAPLSNAISLQVAHEDQSFSGSAHPWAFPLATDVSKIGYVDTMLGVNRSAAGLQWTSLNCNGVDALGQIPTAFGDGIFADGLDSATTTNYNRMINWVPAGAAAFDWSAPDWTQVPTDPCLSAASGASPQVAESVACSAVTGVRAGATAQDPALRVGSVWTKADAVNFTYLFRVDLQAGAAPAAPQDVKASLPSVMGAAAVNSAFGSVSATLVDAYDSTYLTGTGNYCLLTTPPQTLSSSVCAGHTTYALDNGPLSLSFGVYPPPIGSGTSMFYVAVVRGVHGAHANYDTPVVGVSLLLDTATLQLGGNQFLGDDVAFGFMDSPPSPAKAGFPWMQEP